MDAFESGLGDILFTSVLQQEFANAGKSAEDLGPVFGKMAKSLQGGGADDTIKKLGINLDELSLPHTSSACRK